MKRINIVQSTFLAIALVFATGCDDMLEEKFVSDFGSSNFPSAETAAVLLNEAYMDWAHIYQGHRMGWPVELPTPAMQYHFRSTGTQERHDLALWSWTSNAALFDLMDRIFVAVRTSNDAIQLISRVEGMDPVRQAGMVAEAKAIRSILYFNMVRLWGGMPIIDKPQTLADDLYPARASIAETYAFIAQGLKEAIEDLPTRSEYTAMGIAPGHITKGGAQGILAKVYLTMAGHPLNDASNLQEAKDLLEEIIDSGEWALVQSATPYEDLWDWKNEFNSERMIDIQKDLGGYNYRGIFGYFTPQVATSGVWTSGTAYSAGSALDGVPPEYVKWYEAHDSGPRFQWTIVTQFTAQSNFDKFKPGDLVHYEDGRRAQAYVGKYRAVGAELTSNFASPNNFPILRYADVLLMHSEVTNELGVADYTGLNATRERAGLLPLDGLSQDEFRDAVFLERELELAYEQNLLFDMQRRGFEYIQSRVNGFYLANQNESSPGAGDGYDRDYSILNLTEPHRMLFPIPLNQLSANPNLEQNPGYQ